jgi:hypothetical protein
MDTNLGNIPRGALNAHGYIGGSDVPVIIGCGKWDSQVKLQDRILNRIVTDDDTIAIRFGRHNEDFVAAEYERITGLHLRRYNTTLRSESLPMLVGHPDRLVVPTGQKIASYRNEIRTDCGWEGKTHDQFLTGLYGDDWTDAVPEWELYQCAAYMMLTGCDRWHLAVLLGTKQVRVYELRRDLEMEELIEASVSEWWQRHIIQRVPCEPIDEEDLSILYPKDDGQAIEVELGVVEFVRKLKSMKLQAKKLDLEIAAAELILKARFGTAATLLYAGKPIATWKSSKPRTTFDLSSYIAAQVPGATHDELALYDADVRRTYVTKGASSRRLLLKEIA